MHYCRYPSIVPSEQRQLVILLVLLLVMVPVPLVIGNDSIGDISCTRGVSVTTNTDMSGYYTRGTARSFSGRSLTKMPTVWQVRFLRVLLRRLGFTARKHYGLLKYIIAHYRIL